MRSQKNQKGFTLIELLVVIAIIGLLSSVVFASLQSAREKGKIAQVISNVKSVVLAIELYRDDMGFYPPDVSRGWDPGVTNPMPYNPDTGATEIPVCNHCPDNWTSIVAERWKGPYLPSWPKTPWGGTFDFNYWAIGSTRYGCVLPPGVYIGAQRDVADVNPVSVEAEQMMLDQGFDGDGCLNGEVQIRLFPL